MRAFIFSLDAFVAFTLALVAIYSLIFFSSVPSSYYYLLTQGHYLSRDVLMALSTTTCTGDYGTCTNPSASLLDNVVSETDVDLRKNLIKNTVGDMVPDQFGYVMELRGEDGGWSVMYDTGRTSDNPNEANYDPHAKSSKKLTVSSQIITFGYSGPLTKPAQSTYKYLTCGDEFSPLLTCGESGKNNPSIGGDIVPSSDARVVRLTVFI
jgi:hypothetical protein